MEPGKRGARPYFAVDDINAGVARVKELGGEAGEPMPVPNMGWFATCNDPHGNEFGLWQNDRRRRRRAKARRLLRLVAAPDQPQPVQRQLRVDHADRPRVRRDQVGEPARRDDGASGAPSSSRMRSTIASTWPAKP